MIIAAESVGEAGINRDIKGKDFVLVKLSAAERAGDFGGFFHGDLPFYTQQKSSRGGCPIVRLSVIRCLVFHPERGMVYSSFDLTLVISIS